MPINKGNETELSILLTSFRQSLNLLRKNDPMRMAGATAFFTTFALPPIIFILSQLFGLMIGRRTVGRGLIDNLSDTLGKDGAEQVRQVVRSIYSFNNERWYIIALGIVFLVFVATTLFSEIRNSMNDLWQIDVQEKPGFIFILTGRARSFAVILLAGILFFADLFLESLEVIAGNYVDEIWNGGTTYFKGVLKHIISVIVVASWFILLFRFLADGKPRWKAAIAGGLLTGILFIAGKLLLKFLLLDSGIDDLYGAGGSFVLLLLFVFYSSFLLFYGASYVAVYSKKKQWPIMPRDNAYPYSIQKMKQPGG
jgi:membrane protein